jgi:RNA polymerase sigma-70 factor, ECF subfamily
MSNRMANEVDTVAAQLSDAEVVGRVVAGERALFEVLMRRYNQRVYRAIRSILRNEQEAEDTMQQAYLLAYTHLADYAGASSFSTWLLRIAVNEAFASLRKQGRLTVVDEVPDVAEDVMRPPAETPEHRAVAEESERLLESAVDQLAPLYRTTFMLREVEQLSTTETSEALGITEQTVKVRLHRARRTLRDALSAAVGQPPKGAFAFLAPRCDRVVDATFAAIERAHP